MTVMAGAMLNGNNRHPVRFGTKIDDLGESSNRGGLDIAIDASVDVLVRGNSRQNGANFAEKLFT